MKGKSVVLKADRREKLGSRYCERARKAGRLPAVVYGHGQAPESIALDMKSSIAHFVKGQKVFQLDLAGAQSGGEGQIVLLKELQFNYLGTDIVHADFARVDLAERVRTRVAVHLIGEAKGLKQAGAILMHPTNEIEVECAVKDLPDYLEVPIDELDVGHAITAAEVKLPIADMKLVTDKHSIVAQIVIQLEEVVAEATTAVAGAAEPEVLTAKKPAEGEAAVPGAAGAKPAAGAAGAKDAKAPAAGAKDAKAPAAPGKGAAPKK